ncbi:MAG TPA: MBL fold metallo-hydrolase [Candidatus Marinimicrobia bacterium]|nr:MBL fold metallo-hydrolase [Candidatus Neomarinimicrobiota bacterium]
MSIQVHSVITGPFQENSYLIMDTITNEGVCIDPGDDAPAIISMINNYDCTPLAILNTHAHLDHIGAVATLKKMWDLPFYLHKNESMVLDTYEETCRFFNMTTGETPKVDFWIDDEEPLIFGNMTFTLFFTPGHTPGGTTYIIEDHVFVGDTLFKGSIGRTDLPGGNWEILNKSLLKMMETISPDFTLHSGHGPDTTMKMERIENPFLIPIEKQLNSTI